MALGPAHEARECAASVQPVCSMCIKLYVDVHGSSLSRVRSFRLQASYLQTISASSSAIVA